jgi:hypothetical protein
MGETPGKTLLDKPAVAPELTKHDFFNRLLCGAVPVALRMVSLYTGFR